MNEPNSKSEKPKDERKYSQKQFELLNSCSANKDMSAWNQWRQENSDEEILLEGASYWHAYLKGANLKGANLVRADLRGAKLTGSNLEHANLYDAKLQEARLGESILRHANLEGADIRGTSFWHASIECAKFDAAIVDGFTLFWGCKVDRCTNFVGVGLSSTRIRPGLRQLLEYNIRRRSWEEWYKDEDEPIRSGVIIFSNRILRLITNKLLRWLVCRFWAISDYGISTKQIMKTFFVWAVIFASVYLIWGLIDYHLLGTKDYPGVVSNLFVLEDSKQAVSGWLVPLRAIYFSIVTMTTLGFGDMYANAHSLIRGIFGHILLAFQVILGYVLLGALVTRFAVLFTAGGPAGKFADEKEKTQKIEKVSQRG